jgi:hypothetical protein
MEVADDQISNVFEICTNIMAYLIFFPSPISLVRSWDYIKHVITDVGSSVLGRVPIHKRIFTKLIFDDFLAQVPQCCT